MNLRILSFNIHKGMAPYRFRKSALEDIRSLMRDLNPDVVFLQEVFGGSERQFEFLADSFWRHFAYGKNAVYPSGDHGNVILSKFPIKEWENFDLSTNRLERRGILHARLEIPDQDKELHAFCTHLDLLEKNRFKQIQKIRKVLRERLPSKHPSILAGDFNDWTDNVATRFEKDSGFMEIGRKLHQNPLKTFPSIWPMLPLDRIYARDLKAISLEVVHKERALQRLISDHLPLLATVSF